MRIGIRARGGAAAIAMAVFGAASAAAQDNSCCERMQTVEKRVHKLLLDWGGLNRYGSENTEARNPKDGENRVVFLGDEITELWGADEAQPFFPGKPYYNRGIERQTSAQMLVRFRQDVISLKPKLVVIHAGSNDVAGLTGPATQAMIAENLASMTELAKANGIGVVLASVTPVCDCGANQTALRSPGRIIGLNGWIKEYAAQSGAVFLDYHAALAEGRNFKKELTSDGLLPNAAGYRVMADLAANAIAKALAGK